MEKGNRPGKKRLFCGLLLIVILLITMTGGALIYLIGTYSRGQKLYDYIKSNQRGWEGKVHQADPVYGFSPIPDSRGKHIFPIGPSIPMGYDSWGCRIPLKESLPKKSRPRIFSLGGSFTYGDACLAEDTFTWQAGKILQAQAINGGVCSYGLAEMLLRGQELIPQIKPDFIIVQWSHWLLSRAQRPFGPFEYGLLPTPYFYDSPEGIKIHPPVFQTILFDLPFDKFRHTPRSRDDYLKFLAQAALPLFIHDDWNMLCYRVKSALGIYPEPSEDKKGIVSKVYLELAELARKHGGEAIILNLPWQAKPAPPPEDLKKLGLKIIDAQPPLLKQLPKHKKKVNFRRKFTHYRGEPAHQVDKHPNPIAHGIIGAQIADQLKAQGEK